MRWVVARVPCGLGSLLLGAVACGFVGAIVARHALVGFAGSQVAAVGAALAGLGLAGLGCLRRGLRRFWRESFGRLG